MSKKQETGVTTVHNIMSGMTMGERGVAMCDAINDYCATTAHLSQQCAVVDVSDMTIVAGIVAATYDAHIGVAVGNDMVGSVLANIDRVTIRGSNKDAIYVRAMILVSLIQVDAAPIRHFFKTKGRSTFSDAMIEAVARTLIEPNMPDDWMWVQYADAVQSRHDKEAVF